MPQVRNQCTTVTADECQEECYAYKQANAETQPTYLNVKATLSEFTITPDDFNSKLGTDFEEDRLDGVTGEACYLTNADTGCTEFLKVNKAWNYICDYNKNRIPLYLWKASCNKTISETIYYPVPVLKRNDSCNPQPTWQLVMEKVPVGCSCSRK